MNKKLIFDDFGLLLEPNDQIEFSKQNLQSLVSKYGCLLLRGFDFNQSSFKELTEVLTKKFLTHGAKVRRSVGHTSTQTVTKGPDEIILHFEMHYSPISPDYMWFYCETAPISGGETTLANGKNLYRALKETTRDEFHKKGIRYTNIWAVETIENYFPKFTKKEILNFLEKNNSKGEFLDSGELKFHYHSQPFNKTEDGDWVFGNTIAIHFQYHQNIKLFQESDKLVRHFVSFGDGSEIPDSIFHEITELSRVQAKPHKWVKGDVVLIDNRQILHGRNSYDSNQEREILVRMGIKHSNPAAGILTLDSREVKAS